MRSGLAVSGGPDSLALLLLAHDAVPGRFEVATVDHGLRDGSGAEAETVARICTERAITCTVLPVAVAPAGNLQANARASRYAALGTWAAQRGLGAVATAHHADDQAETLLMRLGRGAGVRGLAAMRPVAPVPGVAGITLVRPLLDWRRAELARVVAGAGIVPAADPSNRNRRFERVRVREALAAAGWLDPEALGRSAAALADADEALDWMAGEEWAAAVRPAGSGLLYLPRAPRAVRMRVLERIIAMLGRSTPRGAELARWHDRLESGVVATLAGVRGDACDPGGWHFTRAAPPRTAGAGGRKRGDGAA